MYIDTKSRIQDQDQVYYNSIRFNTPFEAYNIDSTPSKEFTFLISSEIVSNTVIAIPIDRSNSDTVQYVPHFVHKVDLDTGFILCESSLDPKNIYIQSGNGEKYVISSENYTTILSELCRDELSTPMKNHPLCSTGLLEKGTVVDYQSPRLISDRWIVKQVYEDVDEKLRSEILSKYI